MSDPILLAGAPVAEAVLDDLGRHVKELSRPPGLTGILVGDDAPSIRYLGKKEEACRALGIAWRLVHLPPSAAQAAVEEAVEAENADPAVHGMLVQYPIPDRLDFNAVLDRIDPAKDADGLHPVSLGRLAIGAPGPRSATPAGIVAMLDHYGIPVAGRHVVILGRGPTLGRPLSLMLSAKGAGGDAAVTVVHSRIPDWAEHTRRADIVVAAVGRPSIIQPEHVKRGATVISGGITYQGRKVRPDVDESVADVAGAITPRVGGVGPTTVAMLLRNVVEAAERREGRANHG